MQCRQGKFHVLSSALSFPSVKILAVFELRRNQRLKSPCSSEHMSGRRTFCACTFGPQKHCACQEGIPLALSWNLPSRGIWQYQLIPSITGNKNLMQVSKCLNRIDRGLFHFFFMQYSSGTTSDSFIQNHNKVLKQVIQVDSQLAKTSWPMNLNKRCWAYWRDLSNKHETAMGRRVTEIAII